MISVSWITTLTHGYSQRADRRGVISAFRGWTRVAAAIIVLASLTGLIFSGGLRDLLGSDGSGVHWQVRHLDGFVDALQKEGAVKALSRCRSGYEACIEVTSVFRDFRQEDRRSIGTLLSRYYALSPRGGGPVSTLRFLDAETGTELGYYRNGRLYW